MSYKSEQSKRRIEEIRDKALKDKVQFQNIRTGENGWVNTYTMTEDDFNFLVKKAERVQDLEKRIRVNSELFDMLAHQNKLYRENIENACHKASEILEIDEIINEVLEESE